MTPVGGCHKFVPAIREGLAGRLIARGRQGPLESSHDIVSAGSCATTAQADATDGAALSEAAIAIIEQLGLIDVWINCAANDVLGQFDDVPEKDFYRVTEVTYHGTVNGTRVALANMRDRDRGVVINVCSADAFHGLP